MWKEQRMWKPLMVALALSMAGPAYAQTATDFSFRDDNNDGVVTRNEFDRKLGDAGMFEHWDTDKSGLIDEREFNEIGFDEGFADFDLWDGDDDRYLDSSEVYDGIYDGFDDNENGHWDGGEWDDAGDAGFWDI